ncbi:4066_t:CDS:1, partial [Rhizophagus irregularis]
IHDIGCGLWIKKLNDYIDKSGNLQELVKRNDFQNTASSSSGTLIGQQQLSRHVNSLKPQKQWR